jgi:hypothetical protein
MTPRQEAIHNNNSTYLGSLCLRNHDNGTGCSRRFVTSKSCLACIKETQGECQREWQKKNNQTEKRKAYMRAYMIKYRLKEKN